MRRFIETIVVGVLLNSGALPARASDSAFDPAHDLHGIDVVTRKPETLVPAAKGEVVVFMSSKCPCSNSHVPVIRALAKDFPEFQFAVVHSNADEDEQSAEAYFKHAELNLPVIQDEGSRIANSLKAFKTPHAFVIAPDGKILYRGGVTSSASALPQDKQYLREALNDIRKGSSVRVASGRTLGCAIAR